ncbi:TIGR04283 family arsenosugar biosynthesis glycosyltransferase [Methyloversatilis sp.]|uniref:TIGR04283 family arsenosugar biosynthesis glycosyltransferase n=1 Tax=Methyloversatilis sp. TaxID=2569862 RepID=UPI0027357185|nr:TIGR04283 family arsenosugar biosynthesis glycosyltransferase [Methyloversatilis sp.]MDP2869387.1 TIGR04283 family arsenosugar biosynthesis glycosyltransferase [Methyloversatilis sp.]MDP3455177.1 TIGR04283 family arsenosugar biosynthesis glycosyltransferase [Methyloversatilis sp.]MDP3579574.1 TIGR04283 family arsenosugar biosynthesis glycosyltransferase [Methyloversatilis sp.]
MRRLSIVLPVLNEAATIGDALSRLPSADACDVEIIVADGGSRDETVAIAQAHGARVVRSLRGRALQMNIGAQVASGDVLLFLHADTQLPPDAVELIDRLIADGAQWGRFDVRIDGRHPLLAVIATMMNLRSRLTGIATGDQAIFCSRGLFDSLDGYAPIALMEDIDFSTRARSRSRPACLSARVTTSGRRWERRGVLRTIMLMWRLRLRYFFGADPRDLVRDYRPHHE